MATLMPAVLSDAPVRPSRNLSYIPKPPPPTPAAGPATSPLELGSLAIPNEASISLPNINKDTALISNDQITVHVINQTTGRPAAGLRASLTFPSSGVTDKRKEPAVNFSGMTDSHGQILDWYTDGVPMSSLLEEQAEGSSGVKQTWILTLESEDYWQIVGRETSLPEVVIRFSIDAAVGRGTNHHIPVLLGQWGYTVQLTEATKPKGRI